MGPWVLINARWYNLSPPFSGGTLHVAVMGVNRIGKRAGRMVGSLIDVMPIAVQ